MRTKDYYDVVHSNPRVATTPSKWKPERNNNNYKIANLENRTAGTSTEKKNNSTNQFRKSFSGESRYLLKKPERNHTSDLKSKRKSEGAFRKPIAMNSTPLNKKDREQRNSLFKNGNDNMQNKKKQNKIHDPYDNPILNQMYKTCIEIERQQQQNYPIKNSIARVKM